MKKIFILLLFISTLNIYSKDRKQFTFDDAMKFEAIKNSYLSDNGDWLIYTVKPDRGDGYSIIQSTKNDTKNQIERAESPSYSDNMEVVAFKITPPVIEYLNAKKSDKPKNDLKLFFTSNSEQRTLKNVNSYEISRNGKWLIYRKDENKYKNDKDSDKQIAEDAFLYHINTKTEIYIKNMSDYHLDSTSNYLFYTISSDDPKRDGIYYRELNQDFAPEYTIQQDSASIFSNIAWNNKSKQLAYLFNDLDSNSNKIDAILNIWSHQNGITTAYDSKQEQSWYLPIKNRLTWNEKGESIFFGTKPEAERIDDEKEKDKNKNISEDEYFDKDKITKDAELFLWHWDDPHIVTRQKKLWKSEKYKTYLSVYHVKPKKFLRLSDPLLSSVEFQGSEAYLLGYDLKPYEKRQTYDGWYYDLYIIDQISGKRKLIAKELSTPAHICKSGQYTAFFKDNHWHVYDVYREKSVNITKNIKTVPFYNYKSDTPQKPRPYGFAFFYNENNFFVYSEYDVWDINCQASSILCMTLADGIKNKTKYRFNNFDKKFSYNDSKTLYLKGFNTVDKSSHLAIADSSGFLVFMEDTTKALFNFKAKNKAGTKLIFTRETYKEFPNLWVMNSELEDPKQLSNINPNIDDFIWGNTEMIKYNDPQGEELQGYIIKPENFDPNKKYPLFVYFYEKFSDRRHRFQQPKINHRPIYPMYVGEGYIMFFPDIKFYEGMPGKSGLDAVIAGCEKLDSLGYIDKSKIALHGHSWSGYQSAFFITQTDYFAACVSGAPVSNMTSAYSGIRLGSGLARQFQYEKTQSRIGGTLIDSLDAYIANSPVFFADKINTPLLIMFGDQDDAVPYQQGIELYLACRRFEKDCIMLQYENEPHHLRKYENKLDYATKMKEYFDHYVLGKPAAEWIQYGIKYKGDYMNK